MFKKIRIFFSEVKIETKKVNYPSREELVGSTWVVITTVIIASLFLGVVDLSLSKIIKLLVR